MVYERSLLNKTMGHAAAGSRVYWLFVLIACTTLAAVNRAAAQTTAPDLMHVNYKNLLARADLSYDIPTAASEEGMPIGNGRTGTLVWTTPDALHFQINRVDLFCMGNNTRSFPIGNNCYSSGCGYVDIHMVDYGDDIFSGAGFQQHLSVYGGLTTITGQGVVSRALAWNDQDVIAVETDDQRDKPTPINIDLRMLRFAKDYVPGKNYELLSQHATQVQNGAHTAVSRLDIRDGRIVLVQEFREGTFYSASAVAIGVTGRKSKASYYNESTVRLSAEPARGKYVTLMASAASYDPTEDVEAIALKQLDAAQAKHFDDLLENNRTWWSSFWPKAFIHLHSADDVADNVEENYNYFLYIMASCSRGTYMPRFCGMLWGTNGDLREWGSEYWWHNQGTYFNGLEPANRPELMAPVFATYSRNFESYARAARQQWGSQGIWIPETTWFDGLEDLPDGVAAEMRDLYLHKKPWKEHSAEFMKYAQGKSGMDTRWNWRILPTANAVQDGDIGPFAWTSHILSSTAKIAYAYWLHYAYSADKDWLKTQAYPMIRGAAEFYRNFPNVYKDTDGKYHIRYVNNHESNWGTSDTPEELLAMHEIFPLAIRASEILNVDADMRPLWKEVLDNLTPIPSTMLPAEFYDLCSIGTDNTDLRASVLAAFNKQFPNGIRKFRGSTLSRLPVALSNLGLTDAVKLALPGQCPSGKDYVMDYNTHKEWGGPVMRNRLAMDEGPGAIECEKLGIMTHALHLALLQSVPPSPGKEPINYVFPSWPKDWDAQFTLAARNAFVISASMEKGQIEFVEFRSNKGGPCRVHNPWDDATLSVYRNGKASETISGNLLVIPTDAGETVAIVPKGQPLVQKEVLP
jgi:hypothetical protein